MNELGSIFIERKNCGDCFRCSRECAVKAIKINNSKAEIIESLCVSCGECVSECPRKLIKVRDDVWLSRQYVKNFEIKVASLAPNWVAEFPDIEPHRVVEALKLLGFTHVSESSLAEEALVKQQLKYIKSHKGLHISSRCPAIVSYIKKYHPKQSANLLPFVSPMIAHSRQIKQWWGEQVKVIHISSCPATKDEIAHYPQEVDIALTFNELKQWMQNEGIDFELIPGQGTYCFEPLSSTGSGAMYPLERGSIDDVLLKNNEADKVHIVSKSSLRQVDKILYNVPHTIEHESVYLNLMACAGGCINSAGILSDGLSVIDKEILMLKRYKTTTHNYNLADIDLKTIHHHQDGVGFVAENATITALNSIGIYTEREQINCNACGYVTCRRFAKALSKGNTDRYMCTPFLKREFKDKFSMLLKHMPSGIAIVNAQMNILEINRNFAVMLGADLEMGFDAKPGMEGTLISDIIPFHKMFSDLLESGDDSVSRDVQIKERMVKVSIYTIHKHKLVMAIVRNLFIAQVRNEEIINRTQKVIQENMDTVRKISYLLGENASRTEAILNSILDSQSVKNDNK